VSVACSMIPMPSASFFFVFLIMVYLMVFSISMRCTLCVFFFSSRRRHTISKRDWSSDVCSSDLNVRTVSARSVCDCSAVFRNKHVAHAGAQPAGGLVLLDEDGLAVLEGQDGGSLDGVVVVVKGEAASDALKAAVLDAVDDGLLVLVGTGLQAGLLGGLQAAADGQSGVVAQGREAVGVGLAVLGLVSALKVGVGAGGVVGAEVAAVQLLCSGVLGDAVPAVAAQEGDVQAHVGGLGQDLAHVLVVVGAVDHFGAGVQDGGQLGLEVHVAGGVSVGGDDLAAVGLELGLKVAGQALVVVGAGLVDHSGLGVAQLVGGVIGHLHALERVGEGGAEHVGVDGVGLGVVGDGLGGSGCGDHGHIVVLGLSHNGQGGGGGDVADQSGDALVHHLGKAGDSLGGVALLVHLDDL